jgi:aminopeptidase N
MLYFRYVSSAFRAAAHLSYTAGAMNLHAFFLFLLVGGVGCAMAQDQDTQGIPRDLAHERADRISAVRYDLSFALTPGAPNVSGEVGIRFNLRRTDPLLLDFRDGRVNSAQINGVTSPVVLENGHLELFQASLRKGENDVRIQFTAPVATAGTAINRFKDDDDNSEYIYTLFVPMDASMAFPCFDQPDLKAKFKLNVTAPEDWTVISNAPVENTAAVESGQLRTTFGETSPISTYLFAFAAGHFRKLEGSPGMPAIYARDSVLKRAQPEAARLEQVTSRGMSLFADYFAQPFPFQKYDTVLIPGLAYGGMEHAGATFLREESVLFRTAPTKSDLLRRDILVLHELAHQWFGDLVTMRWFDDLWLKEGFAQYMAFYALDSFEPGENVWKRFYESIKPAAYAIDSTQGTTPVYQDIDNLKDAKSAYGAIVYSKAPGALKQLVYILGANNFRDGLRLYLKEHLYGNAEWADLVQALEKVSRQSLNDWADMWIRHRGMPQVDVTWSCQGNQIHQLTLSQRGVLNARDTWPLATQMVLDYGNENPVRIRVVLAGRTLNVSAAAGKPCPRFVFANDQDFAYGRFLLDQRSRVEVMSRLGSIQDPFLRTLLWGSLWEAVREAQLDPRAYLDLAAKLLPGETDEELARSILARVTTALHRYVSDETRRRLVPGFETLVAERMVDSPDVDLRIVWFRALQGLAETPVGLGQLKNLLTGRLLVPGVELRSLDRWNIVTAVLATGDQEGPALLDAERERDPSGDSEKYAYAAEAARPDPDTKDKYFEDYSHTDSHPEDWVEQSLAPFNSWNQSDITATYLKEALEALPQVKKERKIFFLEDWLDAFIYGQQSAEARDEVHRYLSKSDIDKDLRLKILEAVDELDRTVTIRRAFPN